MSPDIHRLVLYRNVVVCFILLIVCHIVPVAIFFFFFFNDTATTEIYTLSLHDALPIWRLLPNGRRFQGMRSLPEPAYAGYIRDRKSTRLNSSHLVISYAVFCLKKKNKDP